MENENVDVVGFEDELFDEENEVDTENFENDSEKPKNENEEDSRRKQRADFFKEKEEILKLKKEAEERVKNLERENKKFAESFKTLGYVGEVDEINAKVLAEKTGKTVDEIKAEKTKSEKEIEEIVEQRWKEKRDEEVLKEIQMQQAKLQIQEDLKSIKTKFPTEKADNINDLGEKFIKLMATGVVDAVTAYEMTREKKIEVKSTGSTANNGKVIKDFFTVEEVKEMSDAEVKKNYDVIQKSMKDW